MDAAKREKLIRAAVYQLLQGGLLQAVTKISDGQYLTRCVFHSPDNHPSLSLNSTQGLFNCKSCGVSGDALKLYQAATGKDFKAAVAELEQRAGEVPKGRPPGSTKKAGGSAPPTPGGSPKVKGPVLVVPQEDYNSLPELPEEWRVKLEWLKVCDRATAARFGLRLHRDEKGFERLAIPIYEAGELVNIRLYRTDGVKPKFLSWSRGKGPDKVTFGETRLLCSSETWVPDRPVYVCAGEPDLMSGVSFLGLQGCTNTTGEGSWKPEFTEQLRGYHVVIAYDADDAGRKGRDKLILELTPIVNSLAVIDWPETWGTAEDPRKDLRDFVKFGGTLAELGKLTRPIVTKALAPPSPKTVMRRKSEAKARAKQAGKSAATDDGEEVASRGVAAVMALYGDNPLFRDTAGGTYIELNGLLFPLDAKNRELRERMSHDTFLETGKCSSEAITQTIAVLSHRARMEGETLELFTRTGEADSAFWYDLGNGRAVKITGDGWEIVPRPLWFRSFSHQMPQPDPQPGGDVWNYFHHVNIKPENRLLALVVLLSLFIPRIVRPLIHHVGCQGSGKTFAARLKKRLFDPSPIELTSVPHKDEDLDILLFINALLVLDNLSHFPNATADRLSGFITGAAMPRRTLFSDLDMTVLQSNCAVIVTSIADLHHRPDLTERTVRIEFERIKSDRRTTEQALMNEFDAALPGILGGCLDLVSKAMKIHPTVKLHDLPRLADFATWGYALAEAIGPGRGREFMRLLSENSSLQNHGLLDGNALFAAIVDHLTAGKELEGTAEECRTALFLSAKPDPGDKSFPGNATGFAVQLARLEVPLENCGITYAKSAGRTATKRSGYTFTYRPLPEKTNEPDPTPDTPEIVFDDDELDQTGPEGPL